jgi:hypothetical protein
MVIGEITFAIIAIAVAVFLWLKYFEHNHKKGISQKYNTSGSNIRRGIEEVRDVFQPRVPYQLTKEEQEIRKREYELEVKARELELKEKELDLNEREHKLKDKKR